MSGSTLHQQPGPAALSQPGDGGHGQASRLGEYFLEEEQNWFKNKPQVSFYLSRRYSRLSCGRWTDIRPHPLREDSPQPRVVNYKF